MKTMIFSQILETLYHFEGGPKKIKNTNGKLINTPFDKKFTYIFDIFYKKEMNSKSANILRIIRNNLAHNIEIEGLNEKIKHKEYGEDFEYEGLEEINDKYFHKYSYTIKEGGNYGGVLKQFETNGGKLDGTKVYMLDNYDNLVELDRKSRYMKGIKVFVLEEI